MRGVLYFAGSEPLEQEAQRRLEAFEVAGVPLVGRHEARLDAERIQLGGEALRGREEIEVVLSRTSP